jgi:hypothetical protein
LITNTQVKIIIMIIIMIIIRLKNIIGTQYITILIMRKPELPMKCVKS